MNTLQRLILKWKYRWMRHNEREYMLDETPILLPPGHPLDWYQRLHDRYDKFLPVLASELSKDSVVLDVGANIGDSAIPFLRRGIYTWCVEPAPEFLSYLRKNLERNGLTDRATIIEGIITSKTGGVELKVERGTAFLTKQNLSGSEYHTITLDALLEKMGKVDLIKSDTDGFDHDVLLSGLKQIGKLKPIIYFENTVTPDNTYGYNNLYNGLQAHGYHNVCIFDNLGNILDSQASWSTVRSFNNMIIQKEWAHIPYLDILSGTDSHFQLLQKVIQQYRSRYQ